ncbi:MAG: YeeE/YedE family protein [Deltaproteobacteria bacterium]|nr:YeeE/YedE family protein [Deltaproteobacteria bacterium]
MAEGNLIGGFIGGGLIGFASLILLALNGRIAGVSGILAGLVSGSRPGKRWWRVAFVLGLIAGAEVYALARGGLPVHLQAEGQWLIIAGLLVGFGSRIGSGCTSGHGVCGLARRSPRSLSATLTFIVIAVITVFFSRHLLS